MGPTDSRKVVDVSATLSESIEVDLADAVLVRVHHVSRRASGVDMGGRLVFERAALAQLVAAVELQAKHNRTPDQDFVVGNDDISVFGSGHEMSPLVNITVRRDKELPGGGLYNVILSESVANELVAKLRALQP